MYPAIISGCWGTPLGPAPPWGPIVVGAPRGWPGRACPTTLGLWWWARPGHQSAAGPSSAGPAAGQGRAVPQRSCSPGRDQALRQKQLPQAGVGLTTTVREPFPRAPVGWGRPRLHGLWAGPEPPPPKTWQGDALGALRGGHGPRLTVQPCVGKGGFPQHLAPHAPSCLEQLRSCLVLGSKCTMHLESFPLCFNTFADNITSAKLFWSCLINAFSHSLPRLGA